MEVKSGCIMNRSNSKNIENDYKAININANFDGKLLIKIYPSDLDLSIIPVE